MAYFLNYLVIAAVILILLVPVGIFVMYGVIALRQLSIANKEGNINKRKGAQKALLISLGGMLLLVLIGILVILMM